MTIEEVLTAVEASLAAGSARAETMQINDLHLPEAETWQQRAWHGALRGTAAVAKQAIRLANNGESVDFRHMRAQGIADFAQRSWHVERGTWPGACADGACSVDGSTTPLACYDPVWMLIALRTAHTVNADEVLVDLIAASDLHEPDLPLPAVRGASGLRDYALRVTITGGRITRVVREETPPSDLGRTTHEVAYSDYGVT